MNSPPPSARSRIRTLSSTDGGHGKSSSSGRRLLAAAAASNRSLKLENDTVKNKNIDNVSSNTVHLNQTKIDVLTDSHNERKKENNESHKTQERNKQSYDPNALNHDSHQSIDDNDQSTGMHHTSPTLMYESNKNQAINGNIDSKELHTSQTSPMSRKETSIQTTEDNTKLSGIEEENGNQMDTKTELGNGIHTEVNNNQSDSKEENSNQSDTKEEINDGTYREVNNNQLNTNIGDDNTITTTTTCDFSKLHNTTVETNLKPRPATQFTTSNRMRLPSMPENDSISPTTGDRVDQAQSISSAASIRRIDDLDEQQLLRHLHITPRARASSTASLPHGQTRRRTMSTTTAVYRNSTPLHTRNRVRHATEVEEYDSPTHLQTTQSPLARRRSVVRDQTNELTINTTSPTQPQFSNTDLYGDTMLNAGTPTSMKATPTSMRSTLEETRSGLRRGSSWVDPVTPINQTSMNRPVRSHTVGVSPMHQQRVYGAAIQSPYLRGSPSLTPNTRAALGQAFDREDHTSTTNVTRNVKLAPSSSARALEATHLKSRNDSTVSREQHSDAMSTSPGSQKELNTHLITANTVAQNDTPTHPVCVYSHNTDPIVVDINTGTETRISANLKASDSVSLMRSYQVSKGSHLIVRLPATLLKGNDTSQKQVDEADSFDETAEPHRQRRYLELCEGQTMRRCVLKGWLYKRPESGSWIKGWKQRFFRLVLQTRVKRVMAYNSAGFTLDEFIEAVWLLYYDDQDPEMDACACIPLEGYIASMQIDEKIKGKYRMAFEVSHPRRRTYYLSPMVSSSSQDDQLKRISSLWTRSINAAIETVGDLFVRKFQRHGQ